MRTILSLTVAVLVLQACANPAATNQSAYNPSASTCRFALLLAQAGMIG